MRLSRGVSSPRLRRHPVEPGDASFGHGSSLEAPEKGPNHGPSRDSGPRTGWVWTQSALKDGLVLFRGVLGPVELRSRGPCFRERPRTKISQ